MDARYTRRATDDDDDARASVKGSQKEDLFLLREFDLLD